jgi:hypothetical protein
LKSGRYEQESVKGYPVPKRHSSPVNQKYQGNTENYPCIHAGASETQRTPPNPDKMIVMTITVGMVCASNKTSVVKIFCIPKQKGRFWHNTPRKA